ncbi:hypothetical protein [Streptomyces sp. NK15101]|uniref:hypothetical protein n=1 Tax=Streptomyces sp. NK15101 TaxID=2873261 RepID=UPI001CEDEA2F|nr:hypothetical protein [Streptomyces sp. NK15101]
MSSAVTPMRSPFFATEKGAALRHFGRPSQISSAPFCDFFLRASCVGGNSECS